MSFETLKVSELREIADNFAVETEGLKNKADIIAALAEEGVTWAVYKKTTGDAEDDENNSDILPRVGKKEVKPEDMVLVKMTRANFRYDILGYTFTKEHPFAAMSKEDAQTIFDGEEGFRLATPSEVQEYYH